MTRYERTGEFRRAHEGEWFDYHGQGPMRNAPGLSTHGDVWILRRVESPAVETAPMPDYRDGEQTANVVRTLVWAASVTDGQTGHSAACFREAIRRVRAHEQAREYLCTVTGGACLAVAERVLALLDGEHAGEEGKSP